MGNTLSTTGRMRPALTSGQTSARTAATIAAFWACGRGADVVLDIVGGDYLARNLDALALDGHLVMIANPGGTRPPLDIGLLMNKRASVSATTLRARPHAQKAAIVAAVRAEVWPLVSAGRIRPVVDSVFPMDAAAAGHELLAGGGAVGKVLLAVPGR
jgi:NADPH:quinone reductase-like Zn-dependent oxidoreductase